MIPATNTYLVLEIFAHSSLHLSNDNGSLLSFWVSYFSIFVLEMFCERHHKPGNTIMRHLPCWFLSIIHIISQFILLTRHTYHIHIQKFILTLCRYNYLGYLNCARYEQILLEGIWSSILLYFIYNIIPVLHYILCYWRDGGRWRF